MNRNQKTPALQKVEDGLHFWFGKNLHKGGNRQGQIIARVWQRI